MQMRTEDGVVLGVGAPVLWGKLEFADFDISTDFCVVLAKMLEWVDRVGLRDDNGVIGPLAEDTKLTGWDRESIDGESGETTIDTAWYGDALNLDGVCTTGDCVENATYCRCKELLGNSPEVGTVGIWLELDFVTEEVIAGRILPVEVGDGIGSDVNTDKVELDVGVSDNTVIESSLAVGEGRNKEDARCVEVWMLLKWVCFAFCTDESSSEGNEYDCDEMGVDTGCGKSETDWICGETAEFKGANTDTDFVCANTAVVTSCIVSGTDCEAAVTGWIDADSDCACVATAMVIVWSDEDSNWASLVTAVVIAWIDADSDLVCAVTAVVIGWIDADSGWVVTSVVTDWIDVDTAVIMGWNDVDKYSDWVVVDTAVVTGWVDADTDRAGVVTTVEIGSVDADTDWACVVTTVVIRWNDADNGCVCFTSVVIIGWIDADSGSTCAVATVVTDWNDADSVRV